MSKFIVVPNAVSNKDFLKLGNWALIDDESDIIIDITNSHEVDEAKLRHSISDDKWDALVSTTRNEKNQPKTMSAHVFSSLIFERMNNPDLDVPAILEIGIPELAVKYVARNGMSDERLRQLILSSKSPKLLAHCLQYINLNPDEAVKNIILDSDNVGLMIEYCKIDNNNEMRDKIIDLGSADDVYTYLRLIGEDKKARQALIEKSLENLDEETGLLGFYLTTVNPKDQEIIDIIINNGLARSASVWIVKNEHRLDKLEYTNAMFETLLNNTSKAYTDYDAMNAVIKHDNTKERFDKLADRILSSGDLHRIISATEHDAFSLTDTQEKEIRETIVKKTDPALAYNYCQTIDDLDSMRKVIIDSKDTGVATLYYININPSDDILDMVLSHGDISNLEDILGKRFRISEDHKDKVKKTYKELLESGQMLDKIIHFPAKFPEEKEFLKKSIIKSKNPMTASHYIATLGLDIALKEVVVNSNNVNASLICAMEILNDEELERIVMTHGDYDQKSEFRTRTIF